MIRSMTGFASGQIELTLPNDETISFAVTMKTLNARFFELSCKLPHMLHNTEIVIHKFLKKHIIRGNVFLSIRITNPTQVPEKIAPSFATIQNYLDALSTIKDTFNIQDTITLDHVIKFPNTLSVEEQSFDTNVEEQCIQALTPLLEQLMLTQQVEGKALEKDFAEQFKNITQCLEHIKIESARLITEKKAELKRTIESLEPYADAEKETTEQCMLEARKNALMYEIEKIDINEEIIRFTTHLENIQIVIADTVATHKGRKIDFILQELNREINTIASKSSSVTISTQAIDIKSELEKAREQAQNIV